VQPCPFITGTVYLEWLLENGFTKEIVDLNNEITKMFFNRIKAITGKG
jgi:hypothetical protein